MKKKYVYSGILAVVLIGGFATYTTANHNQPHKSVQKADKKSSAMTKLEAIKKTANKNDIKKLDAEIVKAQKVDVPKKYTANKTKIIDEMKYVLTKLIKSTTDKITKNTTDDQERNQKLSDLSKTVANLKSLSKSGRTKLTDEINKLIDPSIQLEEPVEENTETVEEPTEEANTYAADVPQADTPVAPQQSAPIQQNPTPAPQPDVPDTPQNNVPEQNEDENNLDRGTTEDGLQPEV